GHRRLSGGQACTPTGGCRGPGERDSAERGTHEGMRRSSLEDLRKRDHEPRQHVLTVEVVALAEQAGGAVRSIGLQAARRSGSADQVDLSECPGCARATTWCPDVACSYKMTGVSAIAVSKTWSSGARWRPSSRRWVASCPWPRSHSTTRTSTPMSARKRTIVRYGTRTSS